MGHDIRGKIPNTTDDPGRFKTFTVKQIVDNDGTVHNKLEVDASVSIDASNIEIGDVQLLNNANPAVKINPATEDTLEKVVPLETAGTEINQSTSGWSSGVYTFGSSMNGIEISNDAEIYDGTLDFTITIGGYTRTIQAGESLAPTRYPTFTTVTLSSPAFASGSAFRMVAYQ